MSWFANWFDSSYYHILYKNRDEKEAELFIDNLVQHLQIPQGSTLIDIACGKGRHATYFNSLGLDVIGIDLSPNSIACLLYTSPSPRDGLLSRMPSSA